MDRRPKALVVWPVLGLLSAAACGGSPGPAAPSGPISPPTATPTAPGAFTISLPIRLADNADRAFGLVPFGVHIGDHGVDGHPGLDFEYLPGSTVLAAASGTVQSVMPSGNGTGYGIQISHTGGSRGFRTIYGVGTLAPGIAAGASVTRGQPLGTVDVFTRTIGRTTVTYSMVHFQLDDFSSSGGLTNPNAVPIEHWLDGESRAALEAIWRRARYSQELVEPFLDNPRDVSFPLTRVWAREQGGHAPRIEFVRADGFANDYSYALRDSAGGVLETGTARVEALAAPLSTIDLQPQPGGPPRGGVYDVVGDTMQIDYGTAGAPRPGSLSAASVYRTR